MEEKRTSNHGHDSEHEQSVVCTKPSKYFRDYKGIFILVISCILVLAFIWFFPKVRETLNYYIGKLSATVFGLFIAYILNPIVVYFQPKLQKLFLRSKREKTRVNAVRKARRWSIAIAVASCILIISLLIMLIIPQVLRSVIDLGDKTPALITKISEKFNEWNSDRSWAGNFQQYIDKSFDFVESWVTETVVPMASNAISGITSAAWSVVTFIFNFLIGIVIAVYALKEKRKFISWGKKLSYTIFKPETANIMINTARHGNRIFQGFLVGSLIDSTVVGIICFFFNLIAGIPYPMLIAVLIGVTNIIPFFGPILGAVPSAFIIVLISPVKAIIFIVFVIVLNQIEGNIIAPRILGNRTGISEFWVTFALLFFGAMFGVIGMILGVPILAVIAYTLKVLVDRHAAAKKIVTDTNYYLEVDHYDTETDRFVMIDHEQVERDKAEKVKPRNEKIARVWNKFIDFFNFRKKRDGKNK